MSLGLRSDAGGSSGALAINGVDQLVVNSDGSLVAAQSTPAGLRTKRLATADMFSSEFAASITGTNGYQKLPSGLILQWGTGNFSTTGNPITYPIAFPTGLKALLLGPAGNVGGYIFALNYTVSGFTGYVSAGTTTAHYWLAIGY